MSDVDRDAARRHLRTVLEAGAVGDLADGALLERFVAGRGDLASSSAFAAIMERHGPMVWRVCRDVLRDPHDAEDASQATFLVLARKAASVRRADSVASWLFGVALRVAAKARAGAIRRRDRERRGAEMRAEAAVGPEHEGPWAGLYEDVGRLPDRHRGPVVLCHLEGLTNEQAAARLGLPVRTVQRRLAEAKERLRARLIRRGLAPAVGLLGTWFAAEAAPASWAEATIRAASGIAAGGATASVASAHVASLTEGVVATMVLGRWKIVAALVLALGAASAALVAVARDPIPAGRPARAVAARAEDEIPRPATGPRVEGVVVDEAGKPVAGARVVSLSTFDPRPVVSTNDGTFTLDVADANKLADRALLATADDGARQGVFHSSDLSVAKDPRTPVRIVLKPPREVKVTVVDGTGNPVAGAEVFLPDMIFALAHGTTDARGVAVLRAPAEAKTQWVFGAKSGVGFDYFETYRSIPALDSPPPTEVRLVLDGARTVRVKVVDSEGKPVPDVDLTPMRVQKKGKIGPVNLSGRQLKARSDARGIVAFDWIPTDLRGPVLFHIDLYSGFYGLAKPSQFDPVKPEAEVEARVFRRAMVSGRVTHPGGSPAAGIQVDACGVGTSRPVITSGRVWTGPDGTYTMWLPPEESYMIGVVDDSWAARSLSGIVLREGQTLAGLDFRLGKGNVIRGRMTAGPESVPAVGQTVILMEPGPRVPEGTFPGQPQPLDESLIRFVSTDGEGRYAFRVGPGAYQIRKPVEMGDVRRTEENVEVREGQVIEKDFHLRRLFRPGKTLRGTVRARTPDGPPIAGAIVVEEPIGVRIPPVRGPADDRGQFEMPHHTERAVFYARNPRGDLAGHAIVGEDRGEATIVVNPAASASGRVVDGAGKPRAGLMVQYAILISPEGGDPPIGVVQSVVTDADGRFSATGLLPGMRCKFFASNPEGGNSADRTVDVDGLGAIDLGAILLDIRGTR